MKYQIVRTDGEFVIRKGFGVFKRYIRHATGDEIKFSTETEAVDFIINLSKSSSSFNGLVVRELWSEEYD